MDSQALHTTCTKLIQRISSASTHQEILDLHVTVFGRNGQFNAWSKEIHSIIDLADKKTYGKALNETRMQLEEAFTKAEKRFASANKSQLALDVTIPGLKPTVGFLHPTTVIIRSLNSFFRYLGYSVY